MIKNKVLLTEHLKKFFTTIYNYKYFDIMAIVIYKNILDFAYLFFIQKFSNEILKSDFNIYKFLLGSILVFVVYFTIKLIKDKLIHFIIKLFYCLMFIPISVVFYGKNYDIYAYLLFIIQFLIIILTVYALESIFKSKKKHEKTANNKLLKISSNAIYYMFILNTLIILIACVYYNGLPSLKALNFRLVYEVRESFYFPKIINYLYNFQIKFIFPFLIILYLNKKKYARFMLMIILQTIIYIYKGDKIVLLSIPLVVFTYFLFTFYKKYKIDQFISLIFGGMVLISTIFYNTSSMIYGLFVTRLLIFPAILKFLYIDFFATHYKIGIVGTVFNSVLKIPDPYIHMPYQNKISNLYFDRPEMYANTGFLAEGFARFGGIGVILIPIIFGILLYVISRGSNRNGIYFTAAISVLPLINLNDAYLIPSLTFGGILLLVFVSAFFDLNSFEFKIKRTHHKVKGKHMYNA